METPSMPWPSASVRSIAAPTIAQSLAPLPSRHPQHAQLQAPAPRASGAGPRAVQTLLALGVAAALGATARLRLRRRWRRAPRVVRLTSSPDAHWPLDPEDAKTLRQVVVVHRHGTRFPTKPTGRGNLSWPQRAHFWQSYKGHLTPIGSKTLMDTGTVLRDRYITPEGKGGLFKGYQKLDGRTIAVYTSNVQRTLQSAWSFLLGLVPEAPIFFAFRSERIFSQGLKQAVGVPIYVEDATEGDDRLFHEWKVGDGYKKWLRENTERSEFFNYAKDAPEYIALLDKLYEVTGEWKLRPDEEPLQRLLAAKDVDTQVMIEEAHNRPLLPNIWGEELSPEEVKMLRKIGDETKRCWFGDAQGNYSQSYGKQGSGYLAHKIWRHLQERADGLCHQRFVEFSCHDTTMCALAAYYGIELRQIGFGAIFVFELHQDASGNHVKFYYNRKPDDGASSFANLRPKLLPLGREPHMKSLDDCPEGSFPLADLAAHSQIVGLEETFESFMKLLGRADISPTRESLKALVEDGKLGWVTYEEWHERHLEDFKRFDTDNSGFLCRAKVEAALEEWYGIKGVLVDQVFFLLDRDPERDCLSERDVYLAMCALVGVRGSISGHSAGGVTLREMVGADADEEVNARSTGGITKLMSAANTSDLDRVSDLIRQGADINAQDDYGWTALRYAVRRKDPAVVSELIRLGADVNKASKSGRTPLMSAVANSNANVVQLLIKKGADVHARNDDGLSAFDIASRGMGNSVIRDMVRPERAIA